MRVDTYANMSATRSVKTFKHISTDTFMNT